MLTSCPQTDFEAAAVELGYKDATVLKSRWSNVKRKKINGSGAANGEKTTPKKRKSKADVDENDDQEKTPTPKKRGRPSKAQNAKEDEEAAAANVKEEEAAEDEANAVESTEKLEGDDQG